MEQEQIRSEMDYLASGGSINLSELSKGEDAILVSIPEHPLLYSFGLRPGKMVQCCGYQLFGGPLLVKVGSRQIALGKKLAAQIKVNCA